MAMKTNDELSGCNFLWKIENIRHCWLKQSSKIQSPMFIADALEGTKWFLRLYPAGDVYKNLISFYLHRDKDCKGPRKLEVNYRVAILDKSGSILREMSSTKCNFEKDKWHGLQKYEEIKKIFVTQREAFLPDDTLTVQCTIWNTDVQPVKLQQLNAQTCFRVEKRNFIWKINEFSTIKSGLTNKIKHGLINFDLVFNEGLDFEKKLVLTISSFDKNLKYFSIKVSIINSYAKKEYCGTHEYFAENLKIGMLGTLLFTKQLTENVSRYFPNDVLSLDFQYTYSDGTVSYEQCSCGVIASNVKNEVVESRNEHNVGKEKSEIVPVSGFQFLVKDLKSMYNDKILSDTELRTSTQNFPAHKNILSARSPVFRKMFSNDMKENMSGHVDITDLEDDTLHQMLMYIYTNNFEGMEFDSACKLYVAADKYEILSLRSNCSSFLKANLSPSKACDILALADQHQDDDLKIAVQDFSLQHGKQIFGSLEWKNFMTTNIHLAADVMYRFTQCKINEL